MDPVSLDPVDEELHCQLMDGFAVIVQLILAVMALSSLLIKRAREHPQRPVRIWLFDVSKQALGGLILHTSNLLGAYFGGQSTVEQSNPCIWYFLNILLDTTIGVGIVWLALGQLTKLAERLDWPDTRSGYYGNPPRISAWCRQALLFFASLLIMKVIIVFLLTYVSIFFTLGSWILWPLALTQSPHLQVIVVMLIFPLIMNIMQFWLVDGVIKEGGRMQGHPQARFNPLSSSELPENRLNDEELGVHGDAGYFLDGEESDEGDDMELGGKSERYGEEDEEDEYGHRLQPSRSTPLISEQDQRLAREHLSPGRVHGEGGEVDDVPLDPGLSSLAARRSQNPRPLNLIGDRGQ